MTKCKSCDTSSTGMINGFDSLRHDAVIRCNHQHDNIGCLGATGAHGGEGRVARRIQEGDHAARGGHVISADVLGNTARFSGGHLGAPDIVQQ